MTTLHINTTDSVAENILSYIEELSQNGEKIELIDDKMYKFEKKGIDEALEQESSSQVFSSQEVLKELCSEN